MALILPKILKLIFESNTNEVWQYFGGETTIQNFQITSIDPFVIESVGLNYLLTSNKDYQDNGGTDYILLTSRKPTRADLNAGRVKIKRWLKHPLFQSKTPDEVVSTWTDKFKFIKEDEQEDDVMSREAGEFLNDGDRAENENAEDEIEMPSRYF